MAGKLAMEFKIAGPNITVCDGQNSFASAITAAGLLNDTDFPVLLVIVDERIELLDKIQSYMPQGCRDYLVENWDEAAVGFLLDKSSDCKCKIRSIGPVPCHSEKPEQVCRKLAETEITDSLFLFKESSSSFVQPALTAYDCLLKNAPSRYLLGSFSPTSKGASIVELLIE